MHGHILELPWRIASLQRASKARENQELKLIALQGLARYIDGPRFILAMTNANNLEEADFFECACPFCAQTLSFPVTYANTAQTCIRCAEVVIVPDHDAKIAKKLPLPLATLRLQLRRFQADDWKDVREFWDDKEGRADDEGAIGWLEINSGSKLSEGQYLCLAMDVTSSRKVLGYVGIQYLEDTREQAHVHVQVNPIFRRQGYATEAVFAILALGFETFHLHRITASTVSREIGCCRMLERVGMRREGEFAQDHLVDGEWQSTTWYAMLASEYRGRSSTR